MTLGWRLAAQARILFGQPYALRHEMKRNHRMTDEQSNEAQQVTHEARKRLEQNVYFRGRSHVIRIDEKDGTLVLHGNVPSFYLKQVLQTELSGIDGVKEIDNRVDVLWPGLGNRDGD